MASSLLTVVRGEPKRVALRVLFAIVASGVAVAFMLGTNAIYNAIFPRLAAQPAWVFVLGSLASIVISSLIVGVLLGKFMPSAAGSGIPQLKAAYRLDKGRLPFRGAWVKLVAGIISLGGGASLGREGPSVYAAGAAASALAGAMGENQGQRRAACAAGAAAGLAAAFNTPLAAITFVMEELSTTINSKHLGGALLAAVTGAFCTWAAVGRNPAFLIPSVHNVTWRAFLLTPLVAFLSALVGVWFQKRTIAMREKVRGKKKVPAMLKPLVGGLLVWIIGICVFLISGRYGVFGLGYQDLNAALDGSLAWEFALLLLIAKGTATSLIYAWGGCGGIFAPSLFFGAMTGLGVAGLSRYFGVPLAEDADLLLALVGMSACFGAVVRAPLTALLIVFEMTNRYEIIPALMMGTIVSQATARLLAGRNNFYDAVLEQDGVRLI